MIAIETIPSIKEARAVVKLLAEFPALKAWLAFSAKDEKHICNGDLLSDAYVEFSTNDQLVAIGINCTSAKYISLLLKSARDETASAAKPFIVYTNNEYESSTVNSLGYLQTCFN